MRFNFRTLLPTVCAAAVVTTGSAFAAPFTLSNVTATVYSSNSNGVASLPASTATKLETFNVSNINFNSTTGYTLGSFYDSTDTSGAAFFSGASAVTSLANTETVFTGSFTTTSAGTINLAHDDGILYFLNGSTTDYFNGTQSPATVAGGQPGIIVGAGTETFRLVYAENGFAPAVLQESFTPAAVTPEPSSIMLLGSGLVGLAGLVRRRFKA